MAQQTTAIGPVVPLEAALVPRTVVRQDVVQPIAAGANGGQGKAVDTPAQPRQDMVVLSASAAGGQAAELQLSPDRLRAMVSRDR